MSSRVRCLTSRANIGQQNAYAYYVAPTYRVSSGCQVLTPYQATRVRSDRDASQTGLAILACTEHLSGENRGCHLAGGARLSHRIAVRYYWMLFRVVLRTLQCPDLECILFFFSCGPTSHAAPVCCRAFPFIHPRLASRIAPSGHLGTTRPGKSGLSGNPAFRGGVEGDPVRLSSTPPLPST